MIFHNTSPAGTPGLLISGSIITYTGSGNFKVIAYNTSLSIGNDGSCELTYAESNEGYAVAVSSGSTTVNGNVNSTGFNGVGVWVDGNDSSVTVNGNVSATMSNAFGVLVKNLGQP